jgi:hypothetical protein
MKLTKVKGSNHASGARFCCLCRRPDETDQDKRQQTRLGMQDFDASAGNLGIRKSKKEVIAQSATTSKSTYIS